MPAIHSENFNDDRRALLKSAALLVGASAINGTLARAAVQNSSGTKGSEPSGLRKRIMGFMLPHEQFPAPQLVQFGVAAERAGFDLLATSDHFQPWQANEGHSSEAWVTLGALGQKTKKVWMGPTVTCPTFRYSPAVVAETFATLSLFSPGRIFLGIGSGEALNEQAAMGSWPKWAERSDRLIEATEIIRKLWTGEQVSHQGKYYKVEGKLYDRPASPIPILMAANGPKAMARAGQYADGLVTDPKTWKEHKNEFVNAVKAAGKNLDTMPVLLEQYAVVGTQKDAEQAAELWRFGPNAFKTYFNDPDPRSIQSRAEKELPLEKVYSDWAVGTDAAAHLKKVNELFESGATIVNIHSGQPDQMRVIDFYGKEVLPRMKMPKAA